MTVVLRTVLGAGLLAGSVATAGLAQGDDSLIYNCAFEVTSADARVLPSTAMVGFHSWQNSAFVEEEIAGQGPLRGTEAELVREGKTKVSFLWERVMQGKRVGKFPHVFRLSLNLGTGRATVAVQSRGSNHSSVAAQAAGSCKPVKRG